MKILFLLPLFLFGCTTVRPSDDFTDPNTGKKCVMKELVRDSADSWWASFQCGESK
jgi:hypothetical protein